MTHSLRSITRLTVVWICVSLALFLSISAENAYYDTTTSTGVRWSWVEWLSQAWVRMIKTDVAVKFFELYDYSNYEIDVSACPKVNYLVNLSNISWSGSAPGSSLNTVYGTSSWTTAMVWCIKVTHRGSVFETCKLSVAPTGRGCIPQNMPIVWRFTTTCASATGISNATFSTGSPLLPKVAWQNTSSGSACYVSCNPTFNWNGTDCQ